MIDLTFGTILATQKKLDYKPKEDFNMADCSWTPVSFLYALINRVKQIDLHDGSGIPKLFKR